MKTKTKNVVRDVKDAAEYVRKQCSYITRQFQAVELWNWIDEQPEPEPLWDIMAERLPWAFNDPSNANSIKWEDGKEAAHTPGPWYTRHGQISSLTSAHGCTIANCNRTSKGISDAEVEANARLIAAAPEMLEALRDIVKAHDVKMGTGAVHLRIALARDVIAKATETAVQS